MNQLLENLNDSCEILMELASKKELYVSIDIDVIDPAFAPATGYLEPGGLSAIAHLCCVDGVITCQYDSCIGPAVPV